MAAGVSRHEVEPTFGLRANQSYFLPPPFSAPADGILVGVLFRLLRRSDTRSWSLSDFGAGVGRYGHALLSLSEFDYRGYDGAGNGEEVSPERRARMLTEQGIVNIGSHVC